MATTPEVPLQSRLVLNLPALGIDGEFINFKHLTMESDKAIVVREPKPDQKTVAIVDLLTGRITSRKPTAGDSAIMSPDGKYMGVRAGGVMQIVDLELQKTTKSFRMPEGETIQFWRWISSSTIALVTTSAAYHWSKDGGDPNKVFDRHECLAGTQIIDYACSADGKWLMATGIKAGPPGQPPVGAMQLFSVEKGVTQRLAAHAGCFTTAKVEGRTDSAMLFCFVEKKDEGPSKLQIIEVGKDPKSPGAPFRIAPKPLPVPKDVAATDFPVAVQVSRKHDLVYIVTKMGFVYLFDLHSGDVIFRLRATDQFFFTTTMHEDSGGVIGVTAKTGQVLLVTVNESALVPYITTTLGNESLAMKLAARLKLGGADELYMRELDSKLSAGDIKGAAQLAASSPGGALRNKATIERFKALSAQPGQQPPALIYFSTLMEKGSLNSIESIELARLAMSQGRSALVEKWLNENKLECSQELGSLLAPYSSQMALQVYKKSGGAHDKVVQAMVSSGQVDDIIPYCKEHNYQPDYHHLLQTLVSQNPKAAQEFASALVKAEGGPLVEIPAVVDLFSNYKLLQECTSFLLDVLNGDKKEQGFLQTKLFEMNLLGGAPQVADAILSSDMFHHFDKTHIARLCEKAGLFHRAMELYSDLEDIKRVAIHSHAIPQETLVNFIGTLTAEDAMELLKTLLAHGRENVQRVVQAAGKYASQLGPEKLIKMFEDYKIYDGLYYFLGSIVNSSENPEVHYKYIVAAAELKQFKEVERVCRDSTVYEPERVKDFLMEAKLQDPRPLIHVCNRHGFIEELTAYLFNNKLFKFIEVYVQKVAPEKTPKVIGKLLDLDCSEEFIMRLLDSVRLACPVEELVEEVETRNRLRFLQPWLEARVAEGNTEAATHNAVGKIYIMLNKDPQTFLKNNQYYDSKSLGKFCEKLDPYLAFLAYRRANGACDEELLEVTNKNGLFKDQARYLVERMDAELWASVLTEDNEYRSQLIDQVTGTALPETKDPDQVSVAVKAFMDAEMPNELIGLLEKLVLNNGMFAGNESLQNLLILTAIQCSHQEGAPPGRAMEYINRLDSFNGPEIAKIALKEEYQLYEEAFAIYKKFEMHVEAVEVLIDHMTLERAAEFAERVDKKEVWSKVGAAQISDNLVKEGVDSYCRANDATDYERVIGVASREDAWEDLVKYLEMAREQKKERTIDSELAFALAMCNRLADLELFVKNPNIADIQGVGERCFERAVGRSKDEQTKLYRAAKILFAAIHNNAKLAQALVRLGEFREAVEAAKKANSIRTWQEVNAACVKAKEFRLAEIAGLHIIVSPDHLEELINHYERGGHFEEVISLMEQGLGLENAHQGIFTELGVLYSRYRPEKLMEHIKFYYNRVNVTRLLRACADGRHWKEAAFLHTETGDFDAGVRVMMEHSPSALNVDKFMDIVQKVRNTELYYQAITFFLEEEPMQLGKLLQVLRSNLDHARVVHQFRRTDEDLILIIDYLKSVQSENISAVNEAVNEVLIAYEDYDGLRESIEANSNFDQLGTAQKIEDHPLLEFRRIAALLYKRNKRWESSISLSKEDKMFKDAIDTAAASGDRRLAEDLLRYFVSDGDNVDRECFAACLFTCYDLISADVALELAWRHRITDYVMPFIVQFVKDSSAKIQELDERTKSKDEDKSASHAAEAAAYGMMGPGMGLPQLAATAYNPQHQGYGMGGDMGMGMGMGNGMGMGGGGDMYSMGGGPGMY